MPSNFLITKFKSRQSSVMYVKDATQNDLFRNSQNHNDTKRVMDFMCSSTYMIHSVKRLTDNVEFSVATRINSNINPAGRLIMSIKIENGEIVLSVTGGAEIALHNAAIYTAPVVTPIVAQPIATAANNASTTNLNQTQKDAFFNTIQNTIIAANPRAVRLPGLLRNRQGQTLQAFLQEFFTNWNQEKDTIFADNREVQTQAGKRRSVGDIFMICKYYYPSCTLKQVYKALLIDLPASMPSGFRTSKCTTINKRVWYYDSGAESGQLSLETTDEYGNKIALLKTNLQ
jgi:hypothetical protein